MKRDTPGRILLDHGSGGLAARELVRGLFLRHLGNPLLDELEDSAVLDLAGGRLAFTTDGYVVDPLFFPGGDIGALAIHGTINDLAMRGAAPAALSAAFVLEEGLETAVLDRVAASMGAAAAAAGVPVVTGDTKVVPRGAADRLFVTTAGVGVVPAGVRLGAACIRPGDRILLSGTIGDHGVTVLTRRAGLALEGDLRSDTRPLHRLAAAVLAAAPGGVHAMRDPTRGGLAETLCELAERAGAAMEIEEAAVPVRPAVRAACELLGLDPLYLANEGKCVVVAEPGAAEAVLAAMRATAEGRGAVAIGRVTEGPPGRVEMRTAVGGRRIVPPLAGDPLPRIC
ncbi:hydrogenase expression/formation protein HypE [Dissulfurirhabdus thermomarina]|uniref:Hydrogenase expression/formation protein HypE n=1 Tax=Dissulfurirhabdus thermomarina TaxID=1765737 RepID=A0A6N9TN78_DISTH|nr:hydrogenase expression/formation protein HypE [Dissulfurirhabdus thermomarina]NDY42599.1 hydrogenase expression/formation protein HypE [Dissulfurirhabdus thermomarina]NMX22656.1 hydrogenase expression/formation protein HypE [Dissulfurirhabdus thermomarina]